MKLVQEKIQREKAGRTYKYPFEKFFLKGEYKTGAGVGEGDRKGREE